MRIDGIRTLAGPNVYTYRPALLMRLDLEDLDGRESSDVPGFVGRLLKLLPGLGQHGCSRGEPGGFVERLYEGTYFGHVVEHVAIELTNLAGVPVAHGKTRHAGEPRFYNVVVEFEAEQGTRRLLESAVELVEAVVRGGEFALEERLREARRLIADTELGPSTRAIVDAAARRGIPWRRVGDGSLVWLGWGKHRKQILAAMTDETSAVAADLVCDKDLTKQLLAQAGVPAPRGRVVRDEAEAVAAFAWLGGAVVVKPLDGRQGLGVSLDLSTEEEVRAAYRVAREFSECVLVEELYAGKNYRVLVVNNRVVAASERLPCQVVGDGRHTIAALVEIANHDPLRGEGHEKPLTKIVIDDIVLAHLRKRRLSLEHVPARGEVVALRDGINLSTGGTARDVTDEMHPSVARMCERAARFTGMDVCGIDLVLRDIGEPFAGTAGGVIEVNASPGLRMHLHPSEGKPRDVGGAIVDMLFPDASDGRVPVVAVTGTNGKTTVTRMIGHCFERSGLTAGVTTTDGIYVGGHEVERGDTTGPHSARSVLFDPSVEVAVLETARGGITRRGLGYDWSDVAVLTNIQPDHFGQDGIESLEDLVYIKSLVAERVRDGGTLVLNADDEVLARLPENERVAAGEKRVVFFTLRENHVVVRRHLAAGGTAYLVRDGWAVEATREGAARLLRVADVPATMSGAARFQVSNVLAATAACRALGLTSDQIAAALSTFRAETANPGRANLYRVARGSYVMLDYGHNPEAFRAVCETAAGWRGRRVTGIVGVPGDRSDALVREAGRVAALGFQRIIIKEDADTRGRARGEVARILCEEVAKAAPGRDCEVIWDEPEALERELRRLAAGDVIVMFYDKLEPLLEVLARHGASAVASIEGPGAHAAGTAAAATTRPLDMPPLEVNPIREPPAAQVAANAASAASTAAARRAQYMTRREPPAATGQLPGWR